MVRWIMTLFKSGKFCFKLILLSYKQGWKENDKFGIKLCYFNVILTSSLLYTFIKTIFYYFPSCGIPPESLLHSYM